MENDIKDKGILFKDFLDKTTNLITLFGVFNALFIYSTTIDSEGAAEKNLGCQQMKLHFIMHLKLMIVPRRF